ncbi:DUF4184 family protein [Nonomuraea sp. NBC_01738]|uniref:DUF4184 family protein n=1 Tax=Nonomuraea sp. NBC_01738 TaxID=2976003 RepID=UPI002E0D9C52|nr:DUF4184 family protein [Nonomuraea sp. NBC_01738]
MPFTPSHVAAVLPLIAMPRVRRWIDPWALAIGAMVPDMPIFLPFLPDYSDWHSWQGVVTLDVLAVVVLVFLFHGLFREPLISLLPPSLSGRAATLTPSYNLLAIVAGALIGAASHVFWDSFTHSYAIEVWGWSFFDVRVLGVIPVFRLLQYGSSVVGLVIVVRWVVRGLSRMRAVEVPDRYHTPWPVRRAVLTACAGGIVLGAIGWPFVDHPDHGSIASVVTRVGAGTLIGLCLVLTVYALGWQVRRAMAVSEGA